MADNQADQEKKSPAKGGRSRKAISAGIVVGVMVLEGGALFFVTKMMYDTPDTVSAANVSQGQKMMRDLESEIELVLPELNAFNKREGRLFLYNLELTIRVREELAEEVQTILDARKSTVLDRFNTVIRGADSKYLNEPNLDTIRRQFRFELNKVLGNDELILEVLIPRFYQSPADL